MRVNFAATFVTKNMVKVWFIAKSVTRKTIRGSISIRLEIVSTTHNKAPQRGALLYATYV